MLTISNYTGCNNNATASDMFYGIPEEPTEFVGGGTMGVFNLDALCDYLEGKVDSL